MPGLRGVLGLGCTASTCAMSPTRPWPAAGHRPVGAPPVLRKPSCPRTTFAEQIERLTVRYQLRTPALQEVVEQVAPTPWPGRPERGCWPTFTTYCPARGC